MHQPDSSQQNFIEKCRDLKIVRIIRMFIFRLKTVYVCAWCHKPTGLRSRILIHFTDPDKISHGVCVPCKNILFNGLA